MISPVSPTTGKTASLQPYQKAPMVQKKKRSSDESVGPNLPIKLYLLGRIRKAEIDPDEKEALLSKVRGTDFGKMTVKERIAYAQNMSTLVDMKEAEYRKRGQKGKPLDAEDSSTSEMAESSRATVVSEQTITPQDSKPTHPEMAG